MKTPTQMNELDWAAYCSSLLLKLGTGELTQLFHCSFFLAFVCRKWQVCKFSLLWSWHWSCLSSHLFSLQMVPQLLSSNTLTVRHPSSVASVVFHQRLCGQLRRKNRKSRGWCKHQKHWSTEQHLTCPPDLTSHLEEPRHMRHTVDPQTDWELEEGHSGQPHGSPAGRACYA